MNRSTLTIAYADHMNDIDTYRIGNLVYYHFDHQTSFNNSTPVKCIARITKLSNDGTPLRLAIVGPMNFIVEIEPVPEHIEPITTAAYFEELERVLSSQKWLRPAALRELYCFHQIQNIYFEEKGFKLNVDFVKQTEDWNDYVYYEQG